jgi:hypothetical protein
MARYTNLKCGNCGYSFTGGYSPGNQSVLGASRIKCPKCYTVNKTNAKPYSQFGLGDNIVFWVGRIIRMVILGLLYGAMLGYGLGEMIDDFSEELIVAGMILGLVGNITYNYYKIKSEIKEAEQEDSQFSHGEKKSTEANATDIEKDRLLNASVKTLSRVENLSTKLTETFPDYDPSKSYDVWEHEENYFELEHFKKKYLDEFEILTWPTTKTSVDENNKIYIEEIALYIKKSDKKRFLNDKLNFSGPVYLKEDLVFDEDGQLILWGYFEHPKTELILQQAKDRLLAKTGRSTGDSAYFVIH